ncbi:lyase family protein [Nonomuraea typhae]|uniref:Lyase family protein n=1 Tax=Nonomuraea typhae TaxID=2603600 RepID=A0ABW7Z5N6_9ACTN
MTSDDPQTSNAPRTPGGGRGPDRPPALDGTLLSLGRTGSAVEAATGDRALVAAMLAAELALTRAWAALGLAPEGAVEAVAAAVSGYDTGAGDLAERARAAGNPVIPLAADLQAAAGEWAHRGATSQDILDTALMLTSSHALGLMLADLDRAAASLAGLAAGHRDTPMAARTLTQHAVPTTFGLKAAGWRALILDARDRLHAVRQALPAQLGGAAGTLAAFHAFAPSPEAVRTPHPTATPPDDVGMRTPHPTTTPPNDIDLRTPHPTTPPEDVGVRVAEAFAGEVGLAVPELPWHVLRSPIGDLAGALAFAAGALGKVAADVLVLSRTEIGEVGEGTAGGSSAMPHKANPVRAAWIAAAARQVPALAAVLFGAMAAEDERPAGAWHAEWQPLRDALRLTGGAARDAAELAAGLRVYPDVMRANLALTGGLVVSERLAATLAAELGRDRARSATADPEALAAMLAARPELKDLLDPAGYLGSAGALVDRALRRTPPEEGP